ncbi:helix-turn-helix domain-containing protein [Rhodococcus triatomae]|uniref:helix-turn-helix domain-containing protein n=1 Tax=Rhodococcus triatomae TaxID=300028 RepID=UPI0011137CED|nr:helix-turn-helix domain-containing protein [Rhodococcus triatomae]QNG20219.1 helix-turn-helix domain-containing protein [Rhodococcus triatomae]QNG23866.1 helix-turn-helix domain-containing protein [Rhodococcus triatomae]
MSRKIEDWVWKVPLDPSPRASVRTQRGILAFIAKHAGGSYSSWPSVRLIATPFGMTPRGVRLVLDALELQGLILRARRVTKHGDETSVRYYINHPDAPHVTGIGGGDDTFDELVAAGARQIEAVERANASNASHSNVHIRMRPRHPARDWADSDGGRAALAAAGIPAPKPRGRLSPALLSAWNNGTGNDPADPVDNPPSSASESVPESGRSGNCRSAPPLNGSSAPGELPFSTGGTAVHPLREPRREPTTEPTTDEPIGNLARAPHLTPVDKADRDDTDDDARAADDPVSS